MNTSKVVFTRSDGETMTFGEGLYGLIEISGIGKIQPEIFTKKKAIGHGQIVTGLRIPGREFTVKADVTDASRNGEALTALNRFFNPLYTFDAAITYLGDTRRAVGCRVRSFDAGNGNAYSPIKPQVTMLCEEAFFLSVDGFGQNVAGASGGFHFPFHTTEEEPLIFGVYRYSGGARLVNDGDVTAWLSATLTMTGPVERPSVRTDAGAVTLTGSFSAGDVIVIDSAERRVTLNGANAQTRLAKDSRWTALELPLGASLVSFTAESGTNNVSCVLTFHKRYLGVN